VSIVIQGRERKVSLSSIRGCLAIAQFKVASSRHQVNDSLLGIVALLGIIDMKARWMLLVRSEACASHAFLTISDLHSPGLGISLEMLNIMSLSCYNTLTYIMRGNKCYSAIWTQSDQNSFESSSI
jgi:hypothetical protein